MGLENCNHCGAVFVKQKSDYCSDCTVWFTETYSRIRDYLRANPNKTIWHVHKELELPLSVVQQVIRFGE